MPAPPLSCCSAPGPLHLPALSPSLSGRKTPGPGATSHPSLILTQPPKEQFTLQSQSKILIKINLPQF